MKKYFLLSFILAFGVSGIPEAFAEASKAQLDEQMFKAMTNMDQEQVNVLKTRGASINSDKIISLLHTSATLSDEKTENPQNKARFEFMLKNGVDINAKEKGLEGEKSILTSIAGWNCDDSLVKTFSELIQKGADPALTEVIITETEGQTIKTESTPLYIVTNEMKKDQNNVQNECRERIVKILKDANGGKAKREIASAEAPIEAKVECVEVNDHSVNCKGVKYNKEVPLPSSPAPENALATHTEVK